MTNQPATKEKSWLDFKDIRASARFGLELKQKGREFEGSCPFHDDARPSFRVSLEKGCFPLLRL